MKYTDNPVKMQKEIIRRTLYLSVIPCLYFLITGRIELLLGLIFGLIISTLLLRLKYIHIKRSLNMKEEKANSFIRNRYFIQYLICFVVLIVAYRNPAVSFLGTAAGLFLMKLTVIGWVIVDLIKNNKEEKLNYDYLERGK